jgi:RimJ/RimL family protein N-acetyltransferase
MTALDELTVIRTERLTLRPLRMEDAGRVFALFADWEVIRWLDAPPWPYALKDAEDFIGRQSTPAVIAGSAFAITRDGALVGGIDAPLRPPNAGQRRAGPSLGYWIGRPYWGHGYMTEAAHGFIARLFATRSDAAIYSGALVGNAASLRVQDKLGFVRDGDSMLYAKPHGREMPHINTVLTRARFAAHCRMGLHTLPNPP